MRKLILIAILAASLGGCANLQNAWKVATSVSVSPEQIIIAANSYDALEATATQYLLYCQGPGIKQQVCAIGNRRPVVKAVRAGRAARNALEPYAVSNRAGPKAVYDVLISAIDTLQNSVLPSQTQVMPVMPPRQPDLILPLLH